MCLNITPDFTEVLKNGLFALTEALPEGVYAECMKKDIEAVLELTSRYEKAAEEAGMTELAETLKQVPKYGARTFREALQSLRIIHYSFWVEGDYHNTLGRFDQYENDDVLIPGLMQLGYAEEDATDYAVAACWEFTIPGKGMEILQKNFEGYDELHDLLKYRSPKMGNDEDEADKFACWLLEIFAESVLGRKNERNGIIRPGTGSAMYYIFHADELGATADGREASGFFHGNH